jgi:hypothetical protein
MTLCALLACLRNALWHPRGLSAAEWGQAMRERNEQMPLPGPHFTSPFCATGAPGVSSARKDGA